MTERDFLLQTYITARQAHRDLRDASSSLDLIVKTADAHLIVDAVYALKKTIELLEDSRKTLSALVELAQKIGCARIINSASMDLVGQWASGYANPGEQPAIPHPEREPEQYAELMRALGASDELIAAKTMRPSFDAVNAYAQELAENGRPLPPAFKHVRKIPRYTIVARAKRTGGMERVLADNGNSLLEGWERVCPSDYY